MGQVTISIKVTNWLDLEKVALGEQSTPARSVSTEALVDTGAVKFYLKASTSSSSVCVRSTKSSRARWRT